jgi:RNA polymerase sigma-70 factor, ECF subfamily
MPPERRETRPVRQSSIVNCKRIRTFPALAGINHQMVITDDRLEPATERDLLARAREGDARAFWLLTQPLQARLLRQATALSGDLTAAEDLVSETLVEAWQSLPRYEGRCRFSTWLYSILMHRWHKAIRRARSRPISLAWLPFFRGWELQQQQQALVSSEPSPAEAASRKELFSQVRRCLEALPKKHRQVLWLRFFEDASLPDMAVVLGCSIGTVKSRLHHALDKLRRMKLNLPDLKGDQPL